MTLIMLATVAAVAGESSLQTQRAEQALRKRKLLEHAAAFDSERLSFYQILARLALGRDIEQCRRDFTWQLENPAGEMFYSLPMMASYLHGHAYWTPEIHAKARAVWKTYLPYRGDTENHWIMWHTALLLAAQTWPDLPGSEWSNGRSSQENYDDALGFLDSWFATTTTIGQGEFDSPDYLTEYLASLFLLYDFAYDHRLRQRAEMAIAWLLADYAIDYLGGAYTGGHSRIYEPRVIDPLSDNARSYAYTLFGDTPLTRDISTWMALFCAVSKYEMPDIIRRIATDRNTPYFARERKRVRNVIRYGDTRNPPVYKHNYMTSQFALGSLDGGLQQPIQIHAWDVTYRYDGHRADNLFSLHPYFSAHELAMFFPEQPKQLVEDVIKSKGTYNKEDKWTGGSPYQRTFQHQNTLIVLYDLAEDTPWRHIDYYFPKSLSRREQDESGWIFAQGGGAFIGVFPFKPGDWREEDTCYRLRSPHLKNGHITVAFDSTAFDSWQAFTKTLRDSKPDLTALESQMEVTYTTIDGQRLRFRFPDQRWLDGKKVDYGNMPLFASPYINGNDGVMMLRHGSEELVLDFNRNEMRRRIVP